MASRVERSTAVEIELLSPEAARDGELLSEITELVNRVYAAAEAGLWVEGATRATTEEIRRMVAAGEIAVARLSGQIVGSVRIQVLDGGIGEFGVLVADPAHRSEGIGRKLVLFAEETCRRRGLRVMQLELLVPREWKHPSKEFLHAWYTRIGYQPIHSGTIGESYPRLAPLLATPCDYVIYRKELTR
jgi:GNAT superfamily N-acetyltransferase